MGGSGKVEAGFLAEAPPLTFCTQHQKVSYVATRAIIKN